MKYIVNVPVCDLRKEASPHSHLYVKDLLQESQLLYGEHVNVKEIQGEWACIEALEQKRYSEIQGWQSYPGWVQTQQLTPIQNFPVYNLVVIKPWVSFLSMKLSFGTYLRGVRKSATLWSISLPDQSCHEIEHTQVSEISSQNHLLFKDRQQIMHSGAFFLHAPYLWGGRSFLLNEAQITSVDCSGLTNLLYRSVGINIPRDAHDQKKVCKEIEYCELQMADFIFTAPIQRPDRITHVMLYLDGDRMLEATMDSASTRFITGKEKLGQPLSNIKSGQTVGDVIVWFGCLKSLIDHPTTKSK